MLVDGTARHSCITFSGVGYVNVKKDCIIITKIMIIKGKYDF